LPKRTTKYCLLHADKKLSDRWATRFGLREFTARDGKSYLNNNPIYLKATFFEEKSNRGSAEDTAATFHGERLGNTGCRGSDSAVAHRRRIPLLAASKHLHAPPAAVHSVVRAPPLTGAHSYRLSGIQTVICDSPRFDQA